MRLNVKLESNAPVFWDNKLLLLQARFPNEVVTLNDAEDLVQEIKTHCETLERRRIPLLLNLNDVIYMSKEAQEYLFKVHAKLMSAVAFVAKSPVERGLVELISNRLIGTPNWVSDRSLDSKLWLIENDPYHS